MAEAAKVRLVRCPKCENLLPELPDYSLYQCGGCGAVLKAKENGLMEDGLSEISDDAKVVEISEKGSMLNVSEVGVESSVGIEHNRTNERNDIDGMVLNGSPKRGTENKEVPFNFLANRKEGERTRRAEYFDDEYSSSAEGMINDRNQGKESGMDMKKPVYSNFHSENELDEIGPPMRSLRSRPALDTWGVERNQSVASSANARIVAPHGRFDSSLYRGERPLSYDMDSYYRYGERIRYRDHDVDGLTRVENLENDRAELLRKLDELKDQLTRSCDLAEKPNDRLGTDRRMPPTPPNPYGRHHADYVQDGLASLHGVNQQPLGPNDLKTLYSSYDRGRIPHMDKFGSTMQDSYPQRNFPPEFLGYGDVYQPEMLRRPTSQLPSKFLQQPSHENRPGHYMDINRNLFASHPHETFFHQPACSCVQCFNNNWHLPPKIHQRSLDDPNLLYYPNPVLQRHQGYRSEGSNSHQMHSRQPLTMSSNDADLENGGLIYHRPKKSVVAHGSGRTCFPIAGGAPFIICCNCFELLKLQRKHISMVNNQQKIKCGACSSIILFELGNNGIIISILPNIDQVQIETDNGSTGTLDENLNYLHGNCGENAVDMDPCFNVYDDSEPKYSPRDKKSHSSESGKRQDPLSLSSSFSESEQRLETVNARKDVSPAAELPFKEVRSCPVPDSLRQECPDHSSANNMVSRYEKGNKSKRSEKEKVGLDKLTSRQNSVKDAPVATEMDVSLNEFSNSYVSQDSMDTNKEDQPRINKGGESFFVGLIKKSFRDFSKSNQNVEDGRSQVFVNEHFIPDRLVKKAEKLAGPIQPGAYWYDIQAGFWGVMGHPCLGIIMPNIEEFDYPMPENCGAGNTGVFVNGRELHQKDLDLLASRGLPITRHGSYIVEISGKVVDEHTGEELDGLGKLAPTVEREKRGFGMKVPRFLARLQH
ncbi:Hypothetical predicted protein [Olea europaea subsp. europaea]|uniref:Zinc-ribbon domain-containing protein n=2 Tax=Olea europaea subsp. europaea TaxID=158383 RepID=A0A8S0Q5I7_OLEEU|nr:Hypothetical predicted protein [Olea europaea subsp. europaea]CAA2961177.1 Hypothetical predicted protein [Olea europaea subsp. europaea]